MTVPGARQRSTDWLQGPAGSGQAPGTAKRCRRPGIRWPPPGTAREPGLRWEERRPISAEGTPPPPRPVPGVRGRPGRAEGDRSAWIDDRRTLGGRLEKFYHGQTNGVNLTSGPKKADSP